MLKAVLDEVALFKRLLTCLAVLCCTITSASGQEPAWYEIEQTSVDVPFEYVQHAILVKGTALDHSGLTFLFDTGADVCLLSKPLFQGIPGPSATHSRNRANLPPAQTGGSKQTRFHLGPDGHGVGVSNLGVFPANFTSLEKSIGRHLDGIVGIAFIAGFVLEIDYTNHLLHFSRPPSAIGIQSKPDNRHTYLLTTRRSSDQTASGVLISGKLNGKNTYDFLLDTGFSGYLSVTKPAAHASGLLLPNTPRIPISNSGLGSGFRGDKIRASALRLGTIDLAGHVLQVDDLSDQWNSRNFGLIGNRFLQNFRVTLDYARGLLWLERIEQKEEADDAEKAALGLSFQRRGASLCVSKIVPGSPAAQANLRIGDCILAINNHPVEGLPLADLTDFLTSPQSPTLLDIQSYGETGSSRTVSLVPSCPLDWNVK